MVRESSSEILQRPSSCLDLHLHRVGVADTDWRQRSVRRVGFRTRSIPMAAQGARLRWVPTPKSQQPLYSEEALFAVHLDFVANHTGCSDVLLLDDSRVHCLVPGNESRVATVPEFVADRADATDDDFFEALLQLTTDAFEGEGGDADGIAASERAAVERGVSPEPSATCVV
jgi:hypothetical protein